MTDKASAFTHVTGDLKMTTRHPTNPNLHLTHSASFNGMDVQERALPMVSEYLQALQDTLERATSDYQRVLAFRVDPVIPTAISDRMTLQDHQSLIRRFIAALKAVIKHDQEMKRRSGWRPGTKVRYFWCREVGDNGKPHYHFLLILNRDAYHLPGRACSSNENLISRISRAWYSALGVAWNPQEPWIHVPQNPWYWVDRDDAKSFEEAFRRASYLCKADTKHYGLGLRAFGTSRS
ncbi:inovirus Gp2 family protein [Halomonas daqingensis]|uniref:Inovirus Gp2 family protein n=1 Tax=Billgrantia desiderata TaxID=52021 RepID=A0AAW4YX01_9GAMM|nr:inovirus Gp2 family protein [Halomonas desiderata]MCE8052531.1 inovirus Gp2 family protein [Halomonas desiderata]